MCHKCQKCLRTYNDGQTDGRTDVGNQRISKWASNVDTVPAFNQAQRYAGDYGIDK